MIKPVISHDTLLENKDRKAKFLSRISSKEVSTTYIVFDTETNQVRETSKVIRQEFKLVCYKVLILQYDGSYEYRENGSYWNLDDFHNQLDVLLAKYEKITFVAHNAGFDIVSCKLLEWVNGKNLECRIFNPSRMSFIIRFSKKSKSISFVDSLNWFSSSLDSLGKLIKHKKQKMPSVTGNKSMWVAYCMNDVTVLCKAMLLFSKLVSKWRLGHLQYTKAQMCFTIFRNYFMPSNLTINKNFDVLKDEYASYSGGRVECFKIGDFTNQNFYLYDVKSLYPSIMQNYQVSYKYLYTKILPDIESVSKITKIHNVLGLCNIETEKPVFPKRYEKRLLFPVGQFKAWLPMSEIKYGIEHKLIKSIDKIHVYARKNIFSNYVNTMFELKEKYEKENNNTFRFIIKIFLNSLYGKFAQKTSTLEKMNITSDMMYDVENHINFKTLEYYTIKIINYEKYRERKNIVAKHSIPIIASEITSASRIYLLNAIEKIGWNHVYYCDTDSLILDCPITKKMKLQTDKKKIGSWILDSKADSLQIRNLKDYEFSGKIRLKGIPRDSKKLSETKYEYTSFDTLIESLRKYSDSIIRTRIQLKELETTYKKGTVDNLGNVYPFVFEQNEFMY